MIKKRNTTSILLHKNEGGFVLLFTVLISVIVVAMALSIFTISYKEIQLTTSAKESNYAFDAADTGIECGLYYDLKKGAFSTTPLAQLACGDQSVTNTLTSGVYSFQFNTADKGCADVAVYKNFMIDGLSYTRIVSFGYNVSCEDIDSTDSFRVVERLLEAKYPN